MMQCNKINNHSLIIILRIIILKTKMAGIKIVKIIIQIYNSNNNYKFPNKSKLNNKYNIMYMKI